MQRMVFWVGLAVVVLLGLALIVGLVDSASIDPLELELRKYLIQFLLIVALGAVVAFIVQLMKDRMERKASIRQYEVETVTSLLDRLDTSYRAVKRERRLLRLAPLEELSRKKYVKALSRVSGDKEDIEKLWRDIEVLENWVEEVRPARPHIKSMEEYLNDLETEWEKASSRSDTDFHADSLEHLPGFVAKAEDPISTFHRFRDPHYKARKLLITLLAAKRADEDRAKDLLSQSATGRSKGSASDQPSR